MVTLIETPTRLVVTGTAGELSRLKAEFRYHPKNYFRSDAYQLWKMTGGERGWDGFRYPLSLKTDTAGEILRGRKEELLAKCEQFQFPCDTSKCLKSPFKPDLSIADIPDDLIDADFRLDVNQKGAIVEWLKHGMGIANMAVNSGKTATFAAAAAYIKRHFPEARFLYFTYAERLVKQVMEAMTTFLPDWSITQYGGGGKRDMTGRDIVIATQAILNRNFQWLEREGFFKSFHALLLDESHHCQAPSAEKVLRASSAYFRLAASDSLKESDPDKFNRIAGLCGPVLCQVSSSTMIEQSRSAAPQLYLVDIPEWTNKFRHVSHEVQERSVAWTLVDNQWVKGTYIGPVPLLDAKGERQYKNQRKLVGDKYVTERVLVTKPTVHLLDINGQQQEVLARSTLLDRRYDRAIIRFKERNKLICDWAKYYADKGWNTVVVATRTTHVLILESLLAPLIPGKVRSLYGEASTPQRNEAFGWFKRTKGAVLVTPLIKEGVSINEIKAGVIADPVADWEVAKQIIGRFMRKKRDTDLCHITWFVDRQHPKYLKNVSDLMGKLEEIEGFTFYHPVAGPETIPQALIHKGKAAE